MNFPFFIAKRIAVEDKASFSKLIIRFAVISVALSVGVMIVSTALMSGFKTEIQKKIFDFWAHIHLTDASLNQTFTEANPIDKNQEFIRLLDTIKKVSFYTTVGEGTSEKEVFVESKKGIRHVQSYGIIPGIIKVKDEIEGVILKGVGKDYDWEFLAKYIKKGRALNLPDSTLSREILISQQTANRLKLDTGSTFLIVIPRQNEYLKRRFTVSGIYKTGLEEYDTRFAFIDLRQVQKLRGWKENEVSGIEIFVEDLDDLDIITEYIYYDLLPTNMYAETVKDKFPQNFEWLELQDINEVVILALMIIVAIINMITALLILIIERTQTVGILKALGNNNREIRKIFLYYAGYILVWGLFWGNLLGLGFSLAQKYFKFITLSEADYYLSVAPIQLNFGTIILLNIGTLVITLIALILPTYMVTKIDPVRAIRFK